MKYYVRNGEFQVIVLASTPEQACILAFRRMFSNDRSKISAVFRVSQKGFGPHEDDKVFSTEVIIKLVQLSNQCKLGNEGE